jgi:hypothetical protein
VLQPKTRVSKGLPRTAFSGAFVYSLMRSRPRQCVQPVIPGPIHHYLLLSKVGVSEKNAYEMARKCRGHRSSERSATNGVGNVEEISLSELIQIPGSFFF